MKPLPGRIWEVILGHCTFLGLQERGCLITFFAIYPFIRKYCYTSEFLWDSARELLVCFLGLMYFLQSSWRLPSNCYCLRCQPLRIRCVYWEFASTKSGTARTSLERSRFKRNPGSSARDSFFQADDSVKDADGLWHPRVGADQQFKSQIFRKLSSDSSKNEIGVLSSVRNGNLKTTDASA